MNRRDFVFSATAALFGAPAFIREAFATGPLDCPPAKERRRLLTDAIAAAELAGKPLLVLTVPEPKDNWYWVRGQAFGEWLNHGSDAALADLATVWVACASTATLRGVIKSVSKADPVMRLLDRGAVVDLQGKIVPPPVSGRGERDAVAIDKVVDSHIETLSTLLADALKATAAERSDATRKNLTTREQEMIRSTGASKLDLSLVDRAAAWLRQKAPNDPQTTAALAAAARKRLVQVPISGSLWAHSTGCGETVEGVADDEQMVVGCGMGFVSERSQRFVRFYACDS